MIFIPIVCLADGPVDNLIYESLLNKHMQNGNINYQEFQKDEIKLDQYLAILSKTDVNALDTNSRFAFYINTYNAFTIKLILSKYPNIKSIKEIGGLFQSPWTIEFIPINGETVSLDHIEHDILRPEFKDPRVHFAVNCASKSCPSLMGTPYESRILEQQLDAQTRAFINDKQQTYFKDHTLYVSKILKWFEKDFTMGVVEFVLAHADTDLKQQIQKAGKNIRVQYLDYDWSLNDS
ncbi:MAG: DUF547 domain-containing protein [Desulfobacteraceae bacterium]|nr:DUF547 domain-containing protein [Desulfobacteraceae bacterium]